MPYSNRVLVIDDRSEDGEAVVRRLWQDQIANCFIKYDEHTIEGINNTFHGIRVIFQDIKLIPGSGIPNHADYGAAAQLIESLLKDNNGPWLMVAWSTWAEDPDSGDKYAQELFDYLLERLPNGKKPHSYIILDKKPYTVDGNHDVVKSEGGENALTEEEKLTFLDEVKESYEKSLSINSISRWERDVGSCASTVVNELWNMTEGLTDSRENELTGLLFKLAKAQDGRIEGDLSLPLYEILASLLSDRLSCIETIKIELEKFNYSGEASAVNTMLHWSNSVEMKNVSSPGAVFLYPDTIKDIDVISFDTDAKKKGFILEQYVPEDKQKIIKGEEEFLTRYQLVMLDITPPCDHDLRKAYWRRYIIGIKVLKENALNLYKDDGKLSHDALYITPEFKLDDESFVLLFNSRLIHSFVDKDRMYKRFTCLGRLREQILHDIVNWYGRMATRPGVVTVS